MLIFFDLYSFWCYFFPVLNQLTDDAHQRWARSRIRLHFSNSDLNFREKAEPDWSLKIWKLTGSGVLVIGFVFEVNFSDSAHLWTKSILLLIINRRILIKVFLLHLSCFLNRKTINRRSLFYEMKNFRCNLSGLVLFYKVTFMTYLRN